MLRCMQPRGDLRCQMHLNVIQIFTIDPKGTLLTWHFYPQGLRIICRVLEFEVTPGIRRQLIQFGRQHLATSDTNSTGLPTTFDEYD